LKKCAILHITKTDALVWLQRAPKFVAVELDAHAVQAMGEDFPVMISLAHFGETGGEDRVQLFPPCVLG
jgi:hypothetical protein